MDDNNNDNPTGKEDEPKDEPLKNLPEQPSDADDLAKENEGVDAPSQVVEEPATAQPQKSSEEEEA